jgi:hypothetical protein
VIASAVAKGETPFWQKWWFPPMCVMAGVTAILGLHRLRLHQISKKMNLRFEERLAERTRVAQELHATLLQGVLSASMQLHVAIDGLPEDSSAKPALNRVLQLMGQVVEEGRNTLRGLRSSVEDAHDLQSSFSRIPQELDTEQGIAARGTGPEELVGYRQSTGGTEGCGDSVGRGKLSTLEDFSPRLSGSNTSGSRRCFDSAATSADSLRLDHRCVTREVF